MVRSRSLEQLSFATAPALYAALWLSAGIIVAQYYWFASGVLISGVLLLVPLSLLAARKALRVALLPLACTWVLLGLLLSEIEPAPDPQTQLSLIGDAGGATMIDGEVTRTTPIRLTQSTLPFGNITREEQSESLDLRVTSADGRPVRGGLRATLYGPANQSFPAIHCGDHVHTLIAMHLPERYLDPGVWDATAWLRQQGIGVVGSLKASGVTFFHAPARFSFACWLHSVQEAGSQRLIDFAGSTTASRLPRWLLLSHEDAGMLSAMILGDRTYLNHQARVGFERTGSFHLLVVSGMHLAIFAACIFGLAALLRLPRVWSTTVTIACSFCYALLAGFGEPVQRSFWMVTLYLLARLLFRERNSLNAIGFAAVCLLALDPRSLAGASFQMTLLSVLIVAGVAVPVAEHTFGPYLQAARNLRLVAIDPSLPPRLAQFRVTLRLVADHLRAAYRPPPRPVPASRPRPSHAAQLRATAGLGVDRTGHVPSDGHLFPPGHGSGFTGQSAGGAADRAGAPLRPHHLFHATSVALSGYRAGGGYCGSPACHQRNRAALQHHGRGRHSPLQPGDPRHRCRHAG